jgi:hypothetical protein
MLTFVDDGQKNQRSRQYGRAHCKISEKDDNAHLVKEIKSSRKKRCSF